MSKNLSLAGKFQIYFKVLASIHIYYSSYWVPSQAYYNKLEKILWVFVWGSSSNHKGFHRLAWEFYTLPKEYGGMGLINYKRYGVALCAKWIIRSMKGAKA